MNAIIRGSLLPFLQSETRDFDPTRGFIYRYSFKGASQALMDALQMDYVRNGIACRVIHQQGDSAALEVEDSTQQYTIDTWEILGNEEARDIWQHPKILHSNIFDDDWAVIREHLENNDDVDTAFADASLQDIDLIVKRFYVMAQAGQTEYRRQQYVLRHKTNAPNRWAVNIADIGIDHIYTTSQLLSEVTDFGLWVYPLPPRLAFKLNAIPVPTFVAGYLWGWLKSASTETTAANNRIDITTDYVLEQWSADYYDPY